MWKATLLSVKIRLLLLTVLFSTLSYGQTTISSEKDITRPEVNRVFDRPASILSASASRNNGYNEIQWTSQGEQDTRKFILEYSSNGINYQTAGETLATGSFTYSIKHPTFEIAPLLYRLRIEIKDGRSYYSQPFLMDGADISPIKIYPTIITGNTVNIRSYFPVDRVTVVSGSGQQMFTKDMGGKTEDMAIVVPSLAKGVYWVSFSGRGWKATDKFVVQ